ncbi:hypothetical protein AB0K16_44310 [Nonomuraea jabiensis]|uniref:hypothetical protein n=1 Tax=Nonomuraea jabiensis TaxID=882448 RepID=UPI0034194D00
MDIRTTSRVAGAASLIAGSLVIAIPIEITDEDAPDGWCRGCEADPGFAARRSSAAAPDRRAGAATCPASRTTADDLPETADAPAR